MGRSDGTILPLQAQYMRGVIARQKADKIAWIGAPLPYPPSRAVADTCPSVEQHFYDAIAADTPTTHRLDVNSHGWGRAIGESGFDLITLFRISPHITSAEALFEELGDFLSDESRTVVFEDMDRGGNHGTSTLYYKLMGAEHAAHYDPRAIGLPRLSERFGVSHPLSVSYADSVTTGTYYTLARKS